MRQLKNSEMLKMEVRLLGGEIRSKIYFFRGMQVMLDSDLAHFYGVETKVLKRAVRRNIERFPYDFMFEVNVEEVKNLLRQTSTTASAHLPKGHGGKRYLPFLFAELGVAMLSSILDSEVAIQINIQVMRTFAKVRELSVRPSEVPNWHLKLVENHEKNR